MALEGDATDGCAGPTSPTATCSTSTWRWRARRGPQRRVAARLRAGGRRAGGGLRRGVPRLRRRRRRARRRLRRRRRGALAPPALRRPVPGAASTGATPSPGEIAAHNMISRRAERRAHRPCRPSGPTSSGINIKSVGLPTVADEVVVTQGSVAERRFVAVYGDGGGSSPRSPSTAALARVLPGADRGAARRSRPTFAPRRPAEPSIGRPAPGAGSADPQPDRRATVPAQRPRPPRARRRGAPPRRR